MLDFYIKNNWRKLYSKWLKGCLGKACLVIIVKKEIIIITVDKTYLLFVVSFLKNHSNCLYKCLCDISGTDFFIKKNRIEVAYQILSTSYSDRITVKINISTKNKISSITSVFPAANWFERELFDIFGVFFKNHPDLRRLLTDYGFEGNPIKKDFPLTGYTEVRFDFIKKRVVCNFLNITQEFRSLKPFTKKNWDYLPNFYFSLK
jgi:NADH dehydrogenase (ubiquinone) Fe-S protein 3